MSPTPHPELASIGIPHNLSFSKPLPHVPDDLTITQLLLDGERAGSIRPKRPDGVPWLVEEATGRGVGLEEIRRRVFGLANGMKRTWGINENDVVCVYSPNHIDYPIAIFATHRLGAVPSPANPSYNPAELQHQLQLSKSCLMFVHSTCLGNAIEAAKLVGMETGRIVLLDGAGGENKGIRTLESLIQEGLAHEPSFIERKLQPGESKTKLSYLCFSSGTTGKPKAVAIPHSSSITNVIQFSTFYRTNDDDCAFAPGTERLIKPGDKALAILPLYHPYGLFLTLHMMLFNGLCIVINGNSKFQSTQMLECIQKHRITHLPIVPPQIVLMCKHPRVKDYDLSSVRMVMSSAAPLSAELTEQLTRVIPGAAIGQVYGMTETGFCTMQPITQHIGTLGSAGQFFPGVKAKVVKTDGTLARYGESGELFIGGPQMTLGYVGNEQATNETWLDGWIRTGDEVVIHENGDLFVKDRIKEVMKVKGFQVAPAELEGHLLDYSDVADACVVGVPDAYSGEAPFAFVVLKAEAAKRAGASKEGAEAVRRSIIKHVSDHKVSYKCLTGGVEFTDSVPRNPSGKLLRRVLREKAKQMKQRSLDAGVAERARL